ncbi:hypothetical protein [Desulfobacterium sp. N47]|uniref:Uncharacterized protein n=1 Tax=uncultured Desulfobacterium sp. TaxID=201089 RepID=E1YF46_9BACT|nr:hypothetical protein N47_J01710 [uncultured Desulfobacterium sp.]
MTARLKVFLMILMTLALFFGFLHIFILHGEIYNFERLHIFLFNLCSGGTILLYFTEGKERLSLNTFFFSFLALSYAVCAFFKLYPVSMLIALVLAVIVEKIRIKRFTFLPYNFFNLSPVSENFHQASLLCLSIGLVVSSLVIANNEYLKYVSFPKLTMDTFFLGFSFPLSLITMSVMFSLMKNNVRFIIRLLKDAGFWAVNLGVIIFFLFIMFEKPKFQLIVTSILFIAVVVIFVLFVKLGIKAQQKKFLSSGMVFLLFTAVTGILYIILKFLPGYSQDELKFLLRLHAFASLYGWNLSGLAILCRYNDFPIMLDSKSIILVHWITVVILAPLGYYFKPFAVSAVVLYAVMLYFVLFSKGSGKTLNN